MTTISVPLTPELAKRLDALVEETGTSRAAIMRKALQALSEERALDMVRMAEDEYRNGKGVSGDLKELVARI